MIRRTAELDAFERRWEGRAYDDLNFDEALERFSALWLHAQRVRSGAARPEPLLSPDWRSGLDSDIAIARAVNGLSPP